MEIFLPYQIRQRKVGEKNVRVMACCEKGRKIVMLTDIEQRDKLMHTQTFHIA